MGLFQKKQEESASIVSPLMHEVRQLRHELQELQGEFQQGQRALARTDAIDGLGQRLDRRLDQVQSAAEARQRPELEDSIERFRGDVQKRLDSLSQALLTLRESRSAQSGPSVGELMKQLESRESERGSLLRGELTALRNWIDERLGQNADPSAKAKVEGHFQRLFEQLERSSKDLGAQLSAQNNSLAESFEKSTRVLDERIGETHRQTSSLEESVAELEKKLLATTTDLPAGLTRLEERLESQLEALSGLRGELAEGALSRDPAEVSSKLQGIESQQREIATTLTRLCTGLSENDASASLGQGLEDLKKQWSELQAAVARGETLEALGERLERLFEAERTARSEEVQAAQADIEALRRGLEEQLGELHTFGKDEAESASTRTESLQSSIKSLQEKLDGLEAPDLTEIHRGLEAIRSEVEHAGKSRLKEAMSLQSEHEKTRREVSSIKADLLGHFDQVAKRNADAATAAKAARQEESERIAGILLPFGDVLDEVVRSALRLAADAPTEERRGLFRRKDPQAAEHRRRLGSWVEGVRLVRARLEKILAELSVEPIVATGSAFDPNRHVAVGSAMVDGSLDGEVIEERQRGYTIGDRVLRYAEVVVGRSGQASASKSGVD
ncbi:MAG: nucleotide exchange factor GrpE [Planctomycetota bacterium]